MLVSHIQKNWSIYICGKDGNCFRDIKVLQLYAQITYLVNLSYSYYFDSFINFWNLDLLNF